MKNWQKPIALLIIIVFIIFVFPILPDAFLLLRDWLSTISVYNSIIDPTLKGDKYVSLLMTPLFSVAAVIISIFALKISISKNRAELIKCATNIRNMIEKNSNEIFQIKGGSGNSDVLNIDSSLDNDLSILLSNNIISKKDYSTCINFLCDARSINESETPTGKQNNASAFCVKYLETLDKPNLKKEMKRIIRKLNKL